MTKFAIHVGQEDIRLPEKGFFFRKRVKHSCIVVGLMKPTRNLMFLLYFIKSLEHAIVIICVFGL